MNERTRTALIAAVPLLAVATMAIGLRTSAGSAVRFASVHAAPLAGLQAGSKATLAWQIRTEVRDRGIREVVPVDALVVTARTRAGQEARWEGKSNAEGIAEASLVLDDFHQGDPLTLEVREVGRSRALARGPVVWAAPPRATKAAELVRPARRDGDVMLDVLVEGGRLVPGFPGSLWVRATAGEPPLPRGGIGITATPEPGLDLARPARKTCDGGYAEFVATAMAHVTGLTLEAVSADRTRGHWFGALPVAAGAFHVETPRWRPVASPSEAVILAPNPRKLVYVELNDAMGRVLGAALPLSVRPGDPVPRAELTLPPLAQGLYWLVVSGDAGGAEELTGATVAKPIVAGAPPEIDPADPCALGPWLASHPAPVFPRWIALEGDAEEDARDRKTRDRGRALAALALVLASAVEVLLLVVIGAAKPMVAPDDGEDLEPAERAALAHASRRGPGLSLLVAVLVALLGFALLGALLTVR